MVLITSLDKPQPRSRAYPAWSVVGVTAIVAGGTALRCVAGANQPLWLDETFTGAIASLRSLNAVMGQVLADVNAPLFLIIAHYWAALVGVSDGALRVPALVCSVVAPLICLVPVPQLARRTRALWCVLVALWAPGFAFAQEARCYSLLFLLSIATIIAFLRVLERAGPLRVSVWAVAAAMAILTHYFALVLIAFQALTLVVAQRRSLQRLWPAAVIGLPVAAWMMLHAATIARFTSPSAAWYPALTLRDGPEIVRFIGGSAAGAICAIAGFLILALHRRRDPVLPRTGGDRVTAWLAAVAAFAATLCVVAVGFVKPSFTQRYLMAFEPGLLLGVALCFSQLGSRSRLFPLAIIGAFALSALSWHPDEKIYGFERASSDLMKEGPHALVFFWDNPNNLVESASQLAIVGGFFFNRAGVAVNVVPYRDDRRSDPNLTLPALAGPAPSSILWIYDLNIHDTAARTHPPRLDRLDSGWSCRDYGRRSIGIYACNRKGSASRRPG